MCTEVLGPINQNNCYQFEELNRKVNRLIKGQDLIGDEFLKLFNIVQTVDDFTILISSFSNAMASRYIYLVLFSQNTFSNIFWY